jgi:hypothetical protein
MRIPKSSDFIERELLQANRTLGKYFKSDAIIIKSPIRFGLDTKIRTEIENLHQNKKSRPNTLSVIIETEGRYIEVVERIYNVLRKHYQIVEFIVPNYAYSAGTVLVLSGDEIYMDYYSVLGPIDPQMENENDRFVSGLGYLSKFEELAEKINQEPDPTKTRAELAYLLKKFDPAELFDLEQARTHSEDLLEIWLSQHKFKDWVQTETTGNPVNEDARKARAKSIAQILGNPKRWHSHGRGIGLKELTNEEIKLKIIDFGLDVDLNRNIRSYYELFIDYTGKIGLSSAIHTQNGLRRI